MPILKLKKTAIMTKWTPSIRTYRNKWPRREAYWPDRYEQFKKDCIAFWESECWLYRREVILEVKEWVC